jgi:hypothetical protein
MFSTGRNNDQLRLKFRETRWQANPLQASNIDQRSFATPMWNAEPIFGCRHDQVHCECFQSRDRSVSL